jgi:hypothetical protein
MQRAACLSVGERIMKSASYLMPILLSATFAGPVAAQDVDGLNDDLRESFYNSTTTLVTRLELSALSLPTVMQTFHGMFDPDSLAIARQSQANFDKQIENMVSGVTGLASALTAIDYTRLTVVALSYQNEPKVFGALPLGFEMNDTAFDAAKFGIEGAFSSNGFAVELTRRGEYVLIHLPNAGLPPAAHGVEIQNAVISGLTQPPATAAIAFAAPTTDYVRSALGMSPGASGDMGRVLGDADYLGGYVVTGARPELHLYARFSGDEKAKAVKAIYDKAWEQQMADARTADKQHEQDIADGKITTVWYINNETMFGRIRAASEMTVFGGVVLLDLDTPDLHQITGALVDGYLRSGQ